LLVNKLKNNFQFRKNNLLANTDKAILQGL